VVYKIDCPSVGMVAIKIIGIIIVVQAYNQPVAKFSDMKITDKILLQIRRNKRRSSTITCAFKVESDLPFSAEIYPLIVEFALEMIVCEVHSSEIL
jgi:hypothetical protein